MRVQRDRSETISLLSSHFHSRRQPDCSPQMKRVRFSPHEASADAPPAEAMRLEDASPSLRPALKRRQTARCTTATASPQTLQNELAALKAENSALADELKAKDLKIAAKDHQLELAAKDHELLVKDRELAKLEAKHLECNAR